MPITPKKMARILKKNGFKHIRTQGSHMFFKNPVSGRATTVPYHSKTLGKGLEQAILKQAGLK
ncbi:type II toxin-antitoxin system HicA family toxin [Listeria sp. FSL L7-1582]|uniref:type II toxin-antitoxin system HicA family toxin n=1 Tax=Listeria portnoyi TaxID=2713504 RepID=UPI00164CE50F|nr:type II toxin-antitoxin system HicA family toxin [Listeria portnoyi]MBC6309681.1 type II toxin-antitoxin system HicA family toxin [Listeria portnoyi]